MNQDQEHLRLLSIFHYVLGGIIALVSCVPIFHLVIGLSLAFGAFPVDSSGMHPFSDSSSSSPHVMFGLMFALFAGVIILTGWLFAGCVILAGRFLSRRTHYMFCLVMACIECFFMPLGTVLGVFTIIVLLRDSVKASFGVTPASTEHPTDTHVQT